MALAYGIATFANQQVAQFTWTPITGPLTANFPIVLSSAVIPTDGSFVTADLVSPPTNTGGSIEASGSFTGLVIVLGADPL